MIINNQNNYQSITYMSSRSQVIKNTDDICRAVLKEFPPVYSNSKLFGYDTLTKSDSGFKMKSYSEGLLRLSRKNYSAPSNLDYQYYREFADMKKYKVSNCGELADATQLALKLNGYDDVKILELYAYNKDTKSMRNLDHCVVGVDFKTPKDYKYNVYNKQYNLSPDYRIYPQNNSVIVDTWLGKSEFSKSLTPEYNSNKALIRGNKTQWEKLKPNEKLLQDGEELCYVPIYQGLKMSDEAMSCFGKMYPKLIMKKNMGKVDLSKTINPPVSDAIPKELVQDLKKSCELGEFAKKPVVEENKKNSIINDIKSFITVIIGIF